MRNIVDDHETGFGSINEHLAHLYAQGEIIPAATLRNIRIVQKEGGAP